MITNTLLPDLVAPSHTGGPHLGPMNQIEHEILSLKPDVKVRSINDKVHLNILFLTLSTLKLTIMTISQ